MGAEWIQFRGNNGRLSSIRADWTDLCAPDLFVTLSDGRADFKPRDLLQLADLIDSLQRNPNKVKQGDNAK
jgi:hypothetical protein